jgi:hypothetical protein
MILKRIAGDVTLELFDEKKYVSPNDKNYVLTADEVADKSVKKSLRE